MGMTEPVLGAARGYQPTRTLPVRAEIRRQLVRRRTKLTFGLMAALPVVLIVAFAVGSGEGGGTGFYANVTLSAANFTVFTLSVSQFFLLVVMVSLFFGDTVASEAGWGSLRYLLAIPVPRTRLLVVKTVVSLLSTIVALVLMTAAALVAGIASFGWDPLRTPSGSELPPGDALLRIGGMVGYIGLTLMVFAAVALLLSVVTDAPLAAVGGAVMFMIISAILDQVTALGKLRNLLPTHYLDAWYGWFVEPIRFEAMAKGATLALGYATVCFIAARWHFARKDILS